MNAFKLNFFKFFYFFFNFETSESEIEDLDGLENTDEHESDDNEEINEEINEENVECSDTIGIEDFESDTDLDETMENDEEIYGKDGFIWSRTVSSIPEMANISRRESRLLEPVQHCKSTLDYFWYVMEPVFPLIVEYPNKRIEDENKKR